MWTILGYQFCSVAIPRWVSAGPELSKVVVGNKNDIAPICDTALEHKKQVYPIRCGNGDSYLNLTSLFNTENTCIYQKLKTVEDEIFNSTQQKMDAWQKDGFSKEKALQYYKWLDSFITSQYKSEFGIEIN